MIMKRIKDLIITTSIFLLLAASMVISTTTITDQEISMSGNIDMGGNNISNVSSLSLNNGERLWKEADCVVDKDGYGDSTTIQGCIDSASGFNYNIFVKQNIYIGSILANINKSNINIDFGGSVLIANDDVDASAMIYSYGQSNISIRNVIVDANNTARRTVSITPTCSDENQEGYLAFENVETRNSLIGYIWGGFHTSSGNCTKLRTYINNIYVHNHPEATLDTVTFSRANDLILINSRFENLGKNVLFYGGNNQKIMQNTFINITDVHLQANNTIFSYNYLEDVDTVYIRPFTADGGSDAYDSRGFDISNNRIINGQIFPGDSAGFKVYDVIIRNNEIIYSPLANDGSNGIILQSFDSTRNIIINNNLIIGAGRAGIYMYNLSGAIIKNNVLKDNGANTSFIGRGNIVDFDDTTPSNNNTFEGNIMIGENITVNQHIRLRGDNNHITNSKCIGTVTTPVYDDGSDNKFFNNENCGTNNQLNNNLIIPSDTKICLNGATCTAYVMFNSTLNQTVMVSP